MEHRTDHPGTSSSRSLGHESSRPARCRSTGRVPLDEGVLPCQSQIHAPVRARRQPGQVVDAPRIVELGIAFNAAVSGLVRAARLGRSVGSERRRREPPRTECRQWLRQVHSSAGCLAHQARTRRHSLPRPHTRLQTSARRPSSHERVPRSTILSQSRPSPRTRNITDGRPVAHRSPSTPM